MIHHAMIVQADSHDSTSTSTRRLPAVKVADDSDAGFSCFDNMSELKRMVNRGYERFWRKRGMVPPGNW